MQTKYRYRCGCEFEIAGPPPTPGGLPRLVFDPYNIRPDCHDTWALLAKGHTKGVFQLESPLGKQWCKTLGPKEMEHMSALGALLRPGCLKAEMEPGVSMTKLYCLRVNGDAPVTSFHPALDPILSPTLQVLVYQEQSMKLGQLLAGFDLKEVDRLRKAIGKKDEKEMTAVGQLFLAKAKEKGVVPYDVAETVWGWIQKSGRYQFNKAHSLSYGVIGYITAFIKTHFVVQYFDMWCRYASLKSEPLVEIAELVNEAKLFDVPILPPDFRTTKKHFSTDFIRVRFGLSDIKGVGPSQINKLREGVAQVSSSLGKRVGEWSWVEVLKHFSHHISVSTMERLISVGAFDYFGLGRRTRMIEEFKLWASLTKTEQAWMRAFGKGDLLTSLKELARPKKEGGGCATKHRVSAVQSRIQLLEKPPMPLEDLPNWVARTETELLGVALTCSEVDALDQRDVNTSCKEFLNGSNGHFGSIILGVKVESVKVVKTKRGKSAGQDMAFLTVSDSSCGMADITVFAEAWEKYKEVLVENSCVILLGERGRNKDGLIVKKAHLMGG